MAKSGFTIRQEEYTTLADFIISSFIRDQEKFTARFPKFNAAFLAAFTAKLDVLKELESTLLISEEQKATTAALYQEATELNNELNFVSNYLQDAGLNQAIITPLKNDLFAHNIEGAVLKIESIKQYLVANQPALEDEGMAPDFPSKLADHKISLAKKNKEQNEFMKSHRELTDANLAHYDELYDFITKIANKGKLLFKNTVYQNEYSITQNLQKMRAASPKPNQP